jgi:hypothetical protein
MKTFHLGWGRNPATNELSFGNKTVIFGEKIFYWEIFYLREIHFYINDFRRFCKCTTHAAICLPLCLQRTLIFQNLSSNYTNKQDKTFRRWILTSFNSSLLPLLIKFDMADLKAPLRKRGTWFVIKFIHQFYLWLCYF